MEHGHCGCGHGHGREENENGGIKKKLVRFTIGAVIFAVGLILQFTTEFDRLYLLIPFLPGFFILGGDVLLRSAKNIVKGKIFDENFLMSVATIGAFILGEYAEGVAVMLFYQVGETVQDLAVGRVRKSIQSLLDIRSQAANLLDADGQIQRIAPETVKAGDLILILPGERIPLDGVVTDGESSLDTSALTGESAPRPVRAGDTALSGSVNGAGVLTVRVTAEFKNSAVSRIIELTENASEKKAKTERFMTKFAKIYTPCVVISAVMLAILPPLFLGFGDIQIWTDWTKRALIFLVVSCPCALVISIPLGFFGGIGSLAKNGILVKGGTVIENLAKIETVAFDKTGTLTKGVFTVTEIVPAGGATEEELLRIAASVEAYSNHPIAKAVAGKAGEAFEKQTVSDYKESAGKGISANLGGARILVGNELLLADENIAVFSPKIAGSIVHVAQNGQYLGYIAVGDEIKEDAKETVGSLKGLGIRAVLLSGDRAETVKRVAQDLGIAEFYGGLLPEDKTQIASRLHQEKVRKGTVAFMGDGINDAPVLASSDVGIAMGAMGSAVAVETADAVFMTDNPRQIITAIEGSKRTKRIVWQNIFLAFFVKLVFLILGVFGLATLWEAVFADVGTALLAVLNSVRAMRAKPKPGKKSQ